MPLRSLFPPPPPPPTKVQEHPARIVSLFLAERKQENAEERRQQLGNLVSRAVTELTVTVELNVRLCFWPKYVME